MARSRHAIPGYNRDWEAKTKAVVITPGGNPDAIHATGDICLEERGQRIDVPSVCERREQGQVGYASLSAFAKAFCQLTGKIRMLFEPAG